MRKLLLATAALALSSGAALAADPPGKGITIYMQMGGNPGDGATLARQTGAAAAAQALGVDQLNEQFSGWAPETMIDQFKQAMAAKPSCIVIMGHPGNEAFMGLVKQAFDQGIEVTHGNAPLSEIQAAFGPKGFGYAGVRVDIRGTGDSDGILYEEAAELGHFCLTADGSIYLIDFGEFFCAMLDFTREETRDWFAEKVLGRELLDIDMGGWMADFGEYLPTDAVLSDGSDPLEMHNRWPVLWAEVNARAVASRGKTGEVVFFMRSGFSGVQAHCPLLWAGDQSVDFTRHDGIGTVITATLSAGLVGNAYSHSDCGGYTSLLGHVRSAELMQRWCEMAAFAPVMRSHEGNRPDENLQYDSTPELLACFAGWSRVHAHLAPYVRQLSDEAVATGLPVQRPLFLHYPDDPALFAVQDQFLYGADLLVAPVIEEGATMREVVLPGDGRRISRLAWCSGAVRASGRQGFAAGVFPTGEGTV